MEAMAVGVPVVTSYIAGIPELAVDHETALVVPAANPLALADAIEELITDPGLRERLAKDARARVEAEHDARRTLDDFMKALGVTAEAAR
jgi:glycosyltransferase involved in cell wall biosynthesis